MRVSQCCLLLRRAADADRVAAEERGEHAGGDAEVDARHLLADAVDVEGAAAHAAVLLGDEEELDAELVAAHRADELHRALVARVELEQLLVRQMLCSKFAEGVQHALERLLVQSGSHQTFMLSRRS